MKTFNLLLILLCAGSLAHSQALTADAGSDKAWCDNVIISNPDTPVLGGLTPASGGVAPYTFEWSLWYQPYSGQPVTPNPALYLDNFQTAHPKLTRKPNGVDSMRAVLKVTDASGNTAQDTVWIYVQRVVFFPAMATFFKSATDTIEIVADMGGAASIFYPYSEYRWRPADYLVDSTAYPARCYAPTTRFYDVYFKDRIGCPLNSRIQVYAWPTSTKDAVIEAVSLQVNPVMRSLTIQGLATGRVHLTDVSGRRVWEEDFSGNTLVQLPASLPSGIYAALVFDAKGKPLLRQKLTLL